MPTGRGGRLACDEIESNQVANPMSDLIYFGMTVLFFVARAGYVLFCEKLEGGEWKS